MKINITGKKIQIGESLTSYAEQRLKDSVTKYFPNAVAGDVIFNKTGKIFSAEIIVNEGTGRKLYIKASSQSDDVYEAYDNALSKLEKQLRRYKSRLKDRGHKDKLSKIEAEEIFTNATKRVIPSDFSTETTNPEENESLIIAEKKVYIEKLTVSDAVMRMDLASLPALVFINKKTEKINFIYHREDGNVSWVETNYG